MNISAASLSELDKAVGCLVRAFAKDSITGFLLQTGPGYRERLTQFFSLLMRARIALKMPVVVARGTSGIQGAAMGYATAHPAWPDDVGTQLLKSFCDISGSDPLSCGVYLETAQESNLGFYKRAGFAETARGSLGDAILWCMYLPQGPK